MENYNRITEKIIGSAIEVHKNLGPGLLENLYRKALCVEMGITGLNYDAEKEIDIDYKGEKIGKFRIDILVENKVVVELKSVDRHDPIFEAQLLSYMKAGRYKIGLLINFNNTLLKNGIKRLIL